MIKYRLLFSETYRGWDIDYYKSNLSPATYAWCLPKGLNRKKVLPTLKEAQTEARYVIAASGPLRESIDAARDRFQREG
jgi:hypothetical protein